ncbi:MAG: protein-L-isoaspartate(D-aspartate) O-methyltransferase [Candidatus Bathyarchaeota archaeon]|nr:protein-L-isoaspartate(D-aspartate) O-methyltransferase [Candidatus Bathyarchaeota archaeon]
MRELGLEKNDWEKLIDSLIKQGILHSSKVIKAMRVVPRTKFLPKDAQAYGAVDTPLPIGFGQTISAPHMVAIMNEALQLELGMKVLEVGAGSGWHAATIAEIVAPRDAPRSEYGHVYTVEIVQELAELARKNIRNAGYSDRVTIYCGDGSKGYPEKAPYERILVTAAAPNVPTPLIEQLKPNGIMLVPVGSVSLFQNLIKVVKEPDGKVKHENLGGVAFVPLTGEYGHQF